MNFGNGSSLCGLRLSLLLIAANGFADSPPQYSHRERQDFWGNRGPQVLEANGLLFVPGYSFLRPPRYADPIILDRETGEFLGPAKFKDSFWNVVPDGIGGWFLKGITLSGETDVPELAHFRSDQTTDPHWRPRLDGLIDAWTVHDSTLYIGGSFTRVDGMIRKGLAAFDIVSGQLRDWNPNPGDAYSVNALAISDGVVYVSNQFTQLVAFDSLTGRAREWRTPPFNNGIRGMIASGNSVFVHGSFSQIEGRGRMGLAALDARTGALLSWDPAMTNSDPRTSHLGAYVLEMGLSCDKLFVQGLFNGIGGANRTNLAALDLVTGRATDWNPSLADISGMNPSPENILITGMQMDPEQVHIYGIAGDVLRIGPFNKGFVSTVSAREGRVVHRVPALPDGIRRAGVLGDRVVVYLFDDARYVGRNGLGVVNAITGELTDWNLPENLVPRARGSNDVAFLSSLTIISNSLYVAGSFQGMGAEARDRLAALDLSTKQLKPWQPQLRRIVNDTDPESNLDPVIHASAENRIFLTYSKRVANGSPLHTLISLDATTGEPVWTQNLDYETNLIFELPKVVLIGKTLYAANLTVNQKRGKIAAIDSVTGQLEVWNPLSDFEPGYTRAFTVHGQTLYLERNGSLVAYDAGTRKQLLEPGWLTQGIQVWGTYPAVSPAINVLGVVEDELFVGGIFQFIGRPGSAGEPRYNFASLNRLTGAITDWKPNVGDPQWITVGEKAIYTGDILSVFPRKGYPEIVQSPPHLKLPMGAAALLSAQATGLEPLAYQWQFNGRDMPSATNSTLVISNLQNSHSGKYRVVVTNQLGLMHSLEGSVLVLFAPAITIQPSNLVATVGSTLVLEVAATGAPLPKYQWRLNGVNIPGAIFPQLVLTNVQFTNAGRYSVVVANLAGTVSSELAEVIVPVPTLSLPDRFADRQFVGGRLGGYAGNNRNTTREPGEPVHAHKTGGKSVWLTWLAPANGIATFSTRGSAFDTLLAVYTGDRLDNLSEIASDDDRGGFLASEVAFNAIQGAAYHIAIDGFAGASGNLMLGWTLDTTVTDAPRILVQPVSQTVPVGGNVTFGVTVQSPTPASYQWMFNCLQLSGATNATLSLTNVNRGRAGSYAVQVSNGAVPVESQTVQLELGPFAKLLSEDKLGDLFDEALSRSPGELATRYRRQDLVSVTVGTLGTQLLHNFGSITELGEPFHGGVPGGASRWFRLRAEADGLMAVDTIGSEIDTVLSVYTGTQLSDLRLVRGDNNSAGDGISAAVWFTATKDQEYLVAVDGVNGSQGVIKLNWRLDPMTGRIQLADWGRTLRESFHLRVGGGTQPGFILEASTNLIDWLPVRMRPSDNVSDLVDEDSVIHPRRFYRAVRRN
jgi:outer membrane protein assembly factor BamB